MKAGQLISILQAVNPESEVCLQLGSNEKYRKMCAKAELLEGEMLLFLSVDKVEIGNDGSNLCLDIVLKQENYYQDTLEEVVAEFDKKYPEFKED